MKKHKLHQWLPLLFTLIIFSACSKKNYPDNNVATQDKYETTKSANEGYTPPPVINISDELAKSNKEGEMYYDNEHGYRYWKSSDGKYYLDAKYESGAKPNKKVVKKNSRKHHNKAGNDDYAHE